MNQATLEASSRVPNRNTAALELATTAGYGSPYAACMAMMMQASGVTKSLPDIQHVASFARSDGAGAATTGLGAACSFMDNGFDVTFAGSLDVESVRRRPNEMTAWQSRFDSSQSRYSFSLEPPTSNEIVALIGRGLTNPWLAMLYADSEVLGSSEISVQPVLIDHLVLSSRELVVRDPGSLAHEADDAKIIDLAQALGGSIVRNSRVSLLAVRRRQVDGDLIRMQPKVITGASYN